MVIKALARIKECANNGPAFLNKWKRILDPIIKFDLGSDPGGVLRLEAPTPQNKQVIKNIRQGLLKYDWTPLHLLYRKAPNDNNTWVSPRQITPGSPTFILMVIIKPDYIIMRSIPESEFNTKYPGALN